MMIYKGHVIHKMPVVYKKNFLMKSKKEVYRFVAGELPFVFECVMDV